MPFVYPPARRDDLVEDHFGEAVPDPYRWLEDPDGPETVAWVAAQNRLSGSYLDGLAGRADIRDRLAELWDFPRSGVPLCRGGRWFWARNSGLQNQAVLYVGEDPAGDGRVLLDPNDMSSDGTVALNGLSVSEDGSLIAYARGEGGSDWQTWYVRKVDDGEDLPDLVEWSKFSGASWRADGSGFYYSGVERPPGGTEYQHEVRAPEIRFHRIGTAQADDVVVFAAPDQPEWLPGAAVSDDGRYLVVSITRGTDPATEIRVLDLADGGPWRVLVAGFEAKAWVVGNDGPTWFVLTDRGADRGRLVAIDLEDPEPEHWREVVPESDATLLEAHLWGGKLVCHYLRDAHSALRIHGTNGTFERDVPLPVMSSVEASGHDEAAMEGRVDADVVHFRVTSFSESGSIWAHDLRTGETRLVIPSAAAVDPSALVTEQVYATSADGARIPMFVTRRRDVVLDGEVPVLLYGYGGFDVPITPGFSVQFAVWVERGGVLAVANLRGGGEFGREWHDAGRLAHKQNVFDDFCACAQWFHEHGWSRPGRTAITGGSNGGLLVGACVNQHPELFGAAVADVGVFDMLRFQRFTIGWAWISDFGDPNDPDQYRWLRAYSPLHNVRPGARYPAVLLLTGDHDDRVVPGHSLKYAATLQAAQAGDEPILLRVETSAGHGAGKPTAKLIEASADRLAFIEAAFRGGSDQ
jgi:prolyl oligopeptidase